ncbi:ion transporter [Marinobacterium sp. AK62]|uniref:Ion transporter n=1 Tax=Marinobacterium alkalitolerans TaxID=1542925 RepID=A0ABS3ZF42_9GAMM|nr:ion transporter [Marinobacterium alkalitolerans]MBP0049664.1 ion transporter [Marinobacterium alkalitolerans]
MTQYWNRLQDRMERLRANKLFETFVIAVIIASALLIGAKTYEESSRFDRWINWLDLGVTLFFLFEIVVRMAAEKRFLDFFKKGWNVFDFVIVVASLVPINDSEMVLIARLLRVFRVLRLVSLIPELRILLAALVKSIPRMGYVALLMFIIFYIYAAIGSFMFSGVDPVLWGNITIAMLTLFRVATFEDWTDVMYDTMEVYPYSWIFYLTFIFLTAFVFLNMMIGIVLDVMQKESAAEQLESGEGEAAEVHWMRERMVLMSEQLDRIERQLGQQDRDSR